MNFKVYGVGKSSKVALFSKELFGGVFVDDENVFAICEYNDIEIHLFSTENINFITSGSFEEHTCLKHKEDVQKIYNFILKYVANNGIGICIFFGSGFPWHGEFVEKLKTFSYAASFFADDPEGAEKTSQYYVKNFFYAFCGGIYFDERRRIEEVYKSWGARKSRFIPLGVSPTKYRKQLNNLTARSVDLVYVGGCYFPKVLRMFRLKHYFGERMLFYGKGWNESTSLVKTVILRFIKFVYRIPQIEELPKDKLVDLYQNTKIGFNMHMSFGPSNQRTYELPANGVMQICDCRDGLKELYEIDKEVVAYSTLESAIRKIEYYLKHDRERVAIAMAGYKKALGRYKLEISFACLLSEIRKDISKNFRDRYVM